MINPIARRSLTCLLEGETRHIQVTLGKPYEESGTFICEYEIIIGGKINTHKIAAIDGIQAIQLALFIIGSTLMSLPGASEWKWNNEAGTGFPTNL
jgi:hypothetical protein